MVYIVSMTMKVYYCQSVAGKEKDCASMLIIILLLLFFHIQRCDKSLMKVRIHWTQSKRLEDSNIHLGDFTLAMDRVSLSNSNGIDRVIIPHNYICSRCVVIWQFIKISLWTTIYMSNIILLLTCSIIDTTLLVMSH